jgi:ribosomal protein S12 methylthiotransferase accessory factor
VSGPDYGRLVDPRCGIVTALERRLHPPEVPPALISFTARVSDSRRLGPWQGDRVALGSAFYDSEQARRAAIGEAVERYCGNFVPRGLVRASCRDLRAAGELALEPSRMVLYSERQYAQRGFPFVRFDDDLRVLWAEGRDLATGSAVWVPASFVYINYYAGALASEPRTNFVLYSGIAAGPGREAAEEAALEELIERDATMIWWLSGSPALGISLEEVPALCAALATPGAAGDPGAIRYHLVQIRTPFAVPVVGALVHDTALGILGLGVACRPDPLSAALKALVEAIHLRSFSRQLLDPEGSVWHSMRNGILDARAYKPYRADRAYLDDYRPDFRDVADLGAQSQIYLDPRMQVHAARLLAPPEQVRLADLPPVASRAAYLERLRRRGFQAVSVDVTTPDVRQAGLAVARVIVPGLYPNAPAAFPFLGGRRLYEEPAALGWLPAPLAEDDLVRAPLPHS